VGKAVAAKPRLPRLARCVCTALRPRPAPAVDLGPVASTPTWTSWPRHGEASTQIRHVPAVAASQMGARRPAGRESIARPVSRACRRTTPSEEALPASQATRLPTLSLRGRTTAPRLLATSASSNTDAPSERDMSHAYPSFRATSHATHLRPRSGLTTDRTSRRGCWPSDP